MTNLPRTVSLKGFLHLCLLLCCLISLQVCRGIVPPQYFVLSLALALLSIPIERFRWRHPPKLAVTLLSTAVVLFTAATVRLDTVVSAFTGAVLLMAGLKMIDEKKPRDCVQILLLQSMTLVAAAFLGTSETFIYHCFSFAFLSGLALLLITWLSRQPDARLAPAVVRQTLARALAMWVLMLPLCILLFFAAPRADLSMLPQGRNDDRSTVGFSNELTLGSVRQIQETNELAFRAEMEEVSAQMLYWRGLILDTPRGAGWYPSRRGRQERSYPKADEGERVRQRITMEPMRYNTVFALDVPLVAHGEGIYPVGDGMFQRGDYPGARRIEYVAVSQVSPVFNPARPLQDAEPYLALADADTPRMRTLVEELTQGLDDDAKVEAILRHLSPPAFSYSLDDLPVARNALEVFVFSEKQGNCEYFAAAMAVMLRMAGIPSRIVAGYRGGVYNQSGGYYIVNQSNAHVWVEAWDAKRAHWRRYDPTPYAVGEAAAENARRYGLLGLYVDALNYRLSSLLFGYDRESQSKLVASVREALSDPRNYIQNNERNFLSAGRTLLVALVAAGLLAVALALLRAALRRARNKREDILLRAFLRAAAKRGYAKSAHEGLEEFARRVRKEAAPVDTRLAEMIGAFASRFEPHYFGNVPLHDGDVAELKDIIRRMRR